MTLAKNYFIIATTLAGAAEPPTIFKGNTQILNPEGGSAARLVSCSIWRYSFSIPTRCASQKYSGSLSSFAFFAINFNGRSHPHWSIPITFTPCPMSYSVASRLMPVPLSGKSGVPISLSRSVLIRTMFPG